MEQRLPEEYENKKIPVADGLGFAWDKETFLKFLSDSNTEIYAILGGDVLSQDPSSGSYKCTYDSWSINRDGPKEDFKEYCRRSRTKAIDYVSKYPATGSTVFAPVLTSEVTAGL